MLEDLNYSQTKEHLHTKVLFMERAHLDHNILTKITRLSIILDGPIKVSLYLCLNSLILELSLNYKEKIEFLPRNRHNQNRRSTDFSRKSPCWSLGSSQRTRQSYRLIRIFWMPAGDRTKSSTKPTETCLHHRDSGQVSWDRDQDHLGQDCQLAQLPTAHLYSPNQTSSKEEDSNHHLLWILLLDRLYHCKIQVTGSQSLHSWDHQLLGHQVNPRGS